MSPRPGPGGKRAGKEGAVVEQHLKLSQVAKRLNVDIRTVRAWVARGRLKAFNGGPRSVRVAESELERLVKSLTA